MSLTFLDLPMILPMLALVLARITGLFVTAPILSSSAVPMRVKVYVSLGIALVVLPNLLGTPVAVNGWVDLLAGLAAELALGAIFGFTLNLIFVGLQLGAHLISQQAGVAMAEVFNPAMESDADILANIYYWIVAIAFFALGGHRMLITSLLDTFTVLPPLATNWPDSIGALVMGAMAASFELAMRIAWPAMLALLLTELAMGFISRTMPQLNILVVGLPLRILVGLGVAVLTMGVAVDLALGGGESVLQELRYALIGGGDASGS